MFWTPGKFKNLSALAEAGLLASSPMRDRGAEFCHSTWKQIFSHAEFKPLDFSSTAAHQKSTEDLIAALYCLGKASLDLPYVASLAAQAAIAPEVLAAFGSPEQKAKYLPGIQSGTALAAICNSEAGSGTNLKAMKSTCSVTDSGMGTLRAFKPLATNAFGAQHIFVSAWLKSAAYPTPRMEMFLVDAKHAVTGAVAGDLNGFRTGNCGSLTIEDAEIDVMASRLCTNGSGVAIFRHCFDFERLYLAAIVAGVLEGIEEATLNDLAARANLLDKQYVQSKVVAVAAARTKLNALIHMVLSGGLADLSHRQTELSLLKWICAEEAVAAVHAAGELAGWGSLNENNIFNKAARDFSALRFFGGTVELQKMTIFGWLTRHFETKNVKAA